MPITVTCAHCGSAVSKRPSQAHWNVHFCDRTCRTAHRRACMTAPYIETVGEAGERIYQHRLVAQQLLGRELQPGEVVHHIDGDGLNNLPSNLVVLSAAEHAREHSRLTWDIERAKALVKIGVSKVEVARLLGTTPGALSCAFASRGLTALRPLRPVRWDENEAIALFHAGTGIRAIARTMGVKAPSIYKRFRRLGLR